MIDDSGSGAPVADRAAAQGPPVGHVALAVLLVGIALIVLGAFLPWVISGATSRNSFATVRTADRLGLVDDGPALSVLRAWYLVPLAAASVPLLLTMHRVRAAAVVGIALAALTGLVATVVVGVAPERGSGPAVSIVGSCVVLAGALMLLVHRRRFLRSGPGLH